jgi:hypothetical protein
MLQSKAGYIDARPHIRQLEEVLLQRTAGPYIRVKLDRVGRGDTSIHVRSTPNTDRKFTAPAPVALCHNRKFSTTCND